MLQVRSEDRQNIVQSLSICSGFYLLSFIEKKLVLSEMVSCK